MLSIYVEKENIFENFIKINNKYDINHIINVHRKKENDEIRIVDNEYEYFCIIIEISKKEIILKIIEKKEDTYSLNVNIDIAMGIIKNDNFLLTIQKLTEIGIRKIIPLKTDFTVVKLDSKKEKWDLIVTESMKQCRAIKKTYIDDIKKLTEIKYENYDKVIFVYEKSNNENNLFNILKKTDKNILYIIGPEGGFSKDEVEFLKDKTYEISLGKRILRAETAAIYLASIISYFVN